MAIRSRTNLYPGINPHFNSHAQQPHSEWVSSHNKYLIYLEDVIEPNLLGSDYLIGIEQSLQIGRYDPATNQLIDEPVSSVADVLITREETKQVLPPPSATGTPTLIMPLAEAVEFEPEFIAGLVIFKFLEDDDIEQPITRIELISRANKPGGSHYEIYSRNRRLMLAGGVNLIEVDLLHESRPVIKAIPSYRDRQPNAYPYHIAVSDAHPTPQSGVFKIYGFGVLEPLPSINLPLDGDDVVTTDFNTAYQQAFESNRRFYWQHVDYAQEPVNFAAYTEADRTLIRQHMATIAANQPEQ